MNFNDLTKEELVELLQWMKTELEETEGDDDAESDAIYDVKQKLKKYK